MNLNNEFIPGYKSDVFFVFGKTIGKQYENFECFLHGVGYYLMLKTLHLQYSKGIRCLNMLALFGI